VKVLPFKQTGLPAKQSLFHRQTGYWPRQLSSDFFALFDAGKARLIALFAFCVVACVLFARCGTLFARFNADFCQRWGQRRVLGGKVLQCAAQCQHLVDTCCAIFHGSIALAQQSDAVCQTDLTCFNTVGSRFSGCFIGFGRSSRGSVGMAFMVMMSVGAGE